MTNQVKQLQVAVSGYDAVAYFDGQAIAGDPAFSSVHNDSLYHFSSEANKQKFDADPERLHSALRRLLRDGGQRRKAFWSRSDELQDHR